MEEKKQGGLCIERGPGESFAIGNDITVSIYDVVGNRAKIRIVAPKSVAIVRTELIERKKEQA